MKNMSTVHKQDGFKSQWGFIMAAVGSWFPAMEVLLFCFLIFFLPLLSANPA